MPSHFSQVRRAEKHSPAASTMTQQPMTYPANRCVCSITKPGFGSLQSMSARCQGTVGQTVSAMPTWNVVTTAPSASKTTVTPAVSTAQPCSQRGANRVSVTYGMVISFTGEPGA